jgi:hypothetical protein
MADQQMIDGKAKKGLLWYAMRCGGYTAVKVLLELGWTSNKDALVNLAITNHDLQMLKLLCHHGTKPTLSHALRAERILAKIGFGTSTLSSELVRKTHTWMERCGHDTWCRYERLESIPSYEERKNELLVCLFVFRVTKMSRSPYKWKVIVPLLAKLEKEGAVAYASLLEFAVGGE